MPDKSNYPQVNWVDGMKINKTHFIAQDDSVTARISDVFQSGITPFNYGLLPSAENPEVPVRIVLYLDQQNVLKVKVFECNAVTPGGRRITISEAYESQGWSVPLPEVTYEMAQGKQEDLYVAISVNPFRHLPVGNLDPAEEPPRHPYSAPEYKVHLIPESQLGKKESGQHMVIVGKVHISEKGTDLEKDYIPPCTCVMSHPGLAAIHTGFEKFLNQLETDVITIIRKIREKEQTNTLAVTLQTMADPLSYFLSTNILAFRIHIPVLPPVYLCETIARCARIIKNSIDANSGKAKEELLNYFAEWCTLNQGDFEKMLFRTIHFEYQHSNLQKSMGTMQEFADVISSLFSRLSALEYIGKKKETSIFVKEQTANKKSFLAD